MKLVHIETGRSLYGGALQVKYLLNGLATHGIDNILVCPKGAAIATQVSRQVVVHEVPFLGELDLRFLFYLMSILSTHRPGLVHVHSRRGADIYGGIAARLCGIPAILTRRVDNPEPSLLGRKGEGLSAIARWKYGLYARIITISLGIQQVLLDEGIAHHKIVCVPSAVDTNLYHPSNDKGERLWFLQTFALNSDNIPVGMSAQFIERKGHRYLVEAASLLVSEFPTLRFLLFGKGELEGEIKRLVEARGLRDYFIFAGFRRDLPRILPHLAMLVHPALMEGLGVSLLQAAACEVPIVACGVGGIPEVVQHGKTGFLVPPGDVNGLALAIKTMLRHPEMRVKMGKEGRKLVCERFSIERMVQGNLEVYGDVLGGV